MYKLKTIFYFSFLFFLSSSLYASDIKEIQETVKEICLAPSSGKSSHYKVSAEGDTLFRVKLLGKIGGEAVFEKEVWEGLQKVIRKDQASDNKNYRSCVTKLTPIFLEKFTNKPVKKK